MPPREEIVLNVRTFKRTGSEPSIEMDIAEMNEADGQPTDDSSFEGYTAAEFDEANRVEMHADWYNEETDEWERIIDGEAATWDSVNAEVSFDLARTHTPEAGQYRFEWVLVEDEPDATTGEVPTSATADEVNFVPVEGWFGYRVTPSTQTELGAREPVNRTVGRLTVEDYIRGPNGPLTLAASPPTDPYHSTYKQYVDAHPGDIENPMTEAVDAGGNDIQNVGALGASELSVTGQTHAILTLSASQAFVTNTEEIIQFDGTVKDTLEEFDPATHKLTVSEGGWYQIRLLITVSGAVDGARYWPRVYVNDVQEARFWWTKVTNRFETFQPLTIEMELNAGDVIHFTMNSVDTDDSIRPTDWGRGKETFATVRKLENV